MGGAWPRQGCAEQTSNQYSTTVFTRWRSLKPCARQGERSILPDRPWGASRKMRSKLHILPQMSAGAGRLDPSVAPRTDAGLP